MTNPSSSPTCGEPGMTENQPADLAQLRETLVEALVSACDEQVRPTWAKRGNDVLMWAPGSLGDGAYREAVPLRLQTAVDALWPLIVAAVEAARRDERERVAREIEREIASLPGTFSDGSAGALQLACQVARRAGSVSVKEHSDD